MIGPDTKNKLKTLIGDHYFDRVNNLLIQRGVVNRNGKPYSNSAVSQVLAGDRRNMAIEDAVRTIIAEEEAKYNQENLTPAS